VRASTRMPIGLPSFLCRSLPRLTVRRRVGRVAGFDRFCEDLDHECQGT
jgi:hypothetical protein